MKYIVTLLLTLFSASTLMAGNLDWPHDYDKVMAQAKKEHRNVYLFIGADTCKFCDKLIKTVFSDAATMKRLHEEYLLIYLSRDRHVIPDNFEQFGVPRHYFLTPDAKVFFQSWGGLEIKGFHLLLDEAELNEVPSDGSEP
jgi:thiol-disulfide isomerase/thioredoxin